MDDESRPGREVPSRRRLTFDNLDTNEEGKPRSEEKQSPHGTQTDRADGRDPATPPCAGTTQEQNDIVSYVPSKGELIRVEALAGCGKTTTIAMICDRIVTRQKRTSDTRGVLYVVYNKKAQMDALHSGKFKKEVDIRTAHSVILSALGGRSNDGNSIIATNEHDRLNVVRSLRLEQEVSKIGGGVESDANPAVVSSRADDLAKSIIKVMVTFQSTVDPEITEGHVPEQLRRLATGKRSSAANKWRSGLPISRYVRWASAYFTNMFHRVSSLADGNIEAIGSVRVPHDAYMKIFQLRGYPLQYDYILVDEAQDLTPCQASIFWGECSGRSSKIIYVFGDQHQRLYRFRGATTSFRDSSNDSNSRTFTLTGSFRFGVTIANLADGLLKRSSTSAGSVKGRSAVEGEVLTASQFRKGTVLARSNNGLLRFLFFSNCEKWCFIDRATPDLEAPSWVSQLESFISGTAKVFKRNKTDFSTVMDLEEYAYEQDDSDLLRYMDLIQFLYQKKKTLASFTAEIYKTFVPLPKDASLAEYDGVILSTVHKAKGLEFDHVLLADDFNLDLMKDQQDSPRKQDEVFTLYVAITRCKSALYLPPDMHRFLLGDGPEADDNDDDDGSSPSAEDTAAAIRQKIKDQETWLAVWDFFSSEDEVPIHNEQDIPWPPSLDDSEADGHPFGLHASMPVAQQKGFLRKLFLRVHPDKFEPVFKRRFSDPQLYESAKDKASALTMSIDERYKVLNGTHSTANEFNPA